MMDDMPPIISLAQTGSLRFPRYVIVQGNHLQNPTYWNSTTGAWHEDESEATIYADVNQAALDRHALLLEAVEDLESHSYQAPLYVEIRGRKPDLDKLKEWLIRALRLVINSPMYGEGPEGAVGFITANIHELEEK